MPDSKRIIVVIGTHRCGTSLLAQILHHLGVDFGDELVGPSDSNPDGHWENPHIVQVQERLQKSLRRQWFWQGGSVPLPEDWLSRPATKEAESELLDILRKPPFSGPLPGFKDPRTVRLLPMWQHVFAELGASPSYVLALREPRDVAWSLNRRDQLPWYAGALLWLAAMKDATVHTEDAVVVDYDQWFGRRAKSVARRLAQALALDVDEQGIKRALACVRTDLRHVAPADTPQDDSAPLRLASELYRSIRTAPTLADAPRRFTKGVEEYGKYAELFSYWARRYEERLQAVEKLARGQSTP